MTKNIRWASSRWAIERIDSRGRPSACPQQPLDVERFTFHPAGKPRRRQQVVQPQRQLRAILGRIEGVQVERTDFANRRLLNLAHQVRQLQIAPLTPGFLQQPRYQNVLAAVNRIGIDPHQRQQARGFRRDPVAQQIRVFKNRRRRRGERLQHRQRQARGRAGRVNRAIHRRAVFGDPRGFFAPVGQPRTPAGGRFGGQLVGRDAAPGRFVLVDPGTKVGRPQLGKRQQQVAQVSLRIDGDRRDAVQGRFFQQRQAQPRLAAAGHPHAHGVRRQIARLVEQLHVAARTAGQVVLAAEIKLVRLLELRHRALPSSQCQTSLPLAAGRAQDHRFARSLGV